VIGYAIVTGILICAHELWRDEAQAWLIARDSPGILELLRMGGYEGSPMLWHLLIMPFAKLGLPFISMQLVNWVLAIATAYLFLSNAPFSFKSRLLFLFGYFMAYEYSGLARSYMLFVFILFLSATYYRRRFQQPYRYAVIVAFLAQATLFGTITASALWVAYCFECLYGGLPRRSWRSLAGCLVIIGIGIVFAIAQMIPPADLNGNLQRWYIDGSRVWVVLSAAAGAFFPIPIPRPHFWNSNIFFNSGIEYLYRANTSETMGTFFLNSLQLSMFALSITAYPLSLMILRKMARIPFFVYCGTSFLTLLLFAFKYYAGIRHGGIVFMLFVFSLWIATHSLPSPLLSSSRLSFNKYSFRIDHIIIVFFAIQVSATPIAYRYELALPFSAAQSVGNFLVSRSYDGEDTFIATYPATYSTPVLLAVSRDRKQFYSLEDNEDRSYMRWNRVDARESSDRKLSVVEVIMRFERGFERGRFRRGILILQDDQKVDASQDFFKSFRLLDCFGQGYTISDETYCVYDYIPTKRK